VTNSIVYKMCVACKELTVRGVYFPLKSMYRS
jgi:hypothetical protein